MLKKKKHFKPKHLKNNSKIHFGKLHLTTGVGAIDAPHLKSRSPNLTSSNCYCTCAADKLLLRSMEKLNYLTVTHHNTHFGFSLLLHPENPLWNTATQLNNSG